MPAVAMRHPYAASYAESEAHENETFEMMTASASNNKTLELARAVDRQAAADVPSFRPPSGWSDQTGTADVIWHGSGSRQSTLHEDQFSDAESWGMHSSETPILDAHAPQAFGGHTRVTSIGSSIFAGRGAKASERKRKGPPPPLPNLPNEHLTAVQSPVSLALASPATDYSGFESASQYSAAEDRFEPRTEISNVTIEGATARVDEWDMARSETITALPQLAQIPSRNSSRSEQTTTNATGEDTVSDPVRRPSLPSSQLDETPPVPALKETQLQGLGVDTSYEETARKLSANSANRPRPERPTKNRRQRDRSPILSYAGGAEEEEKKLAALGDSHEDLRHMSTLGPKLKKNSPAPWELDEDAFQAQPRSSLRDALRGSNDGFEKPFGRFKSRPSIDSQSVSGATRYASALPASSSSKAIPSSLEQEILMNEDLSAQAPSQRSRSKSVSSSAAGMLKGLGLASSAGPANKKSKFAKAFGLGRDDRKTNNSFEAPPLPTGSNISHFASSRDNSGSFDDQPVSPSSRGPPVGPPPPKETAELVDALASANGKYENQAYSPAGASARLSTSPRLGARALPYKKTHNFPRSRESSVNPSGSKDSQLMVSQGSQGTLIPDNQSSPNQADRMASSTFANGAAESSESSTPTARLTSSGSQGRFPTDPERSFSVGSNGIAAGSFPTPGSHEGVQYKLISLEQAREQAKMNHGVPGLAPGNTGSVSPHVGSEQIASMKNSPSMMSFRSNSDEMSRLNKGATNDVPESAAPVKNLKNKKSGFLRMLKKERTGSTDAEALPTSSKGFTPSDGRPGPAASGMPSLSITGSGDEDQHDTDFSTMPALSLRPVSSIFSGFGPEFLDPAVAEGQQAQAASSTTVGGLLAPTSPAMTSRSQESPRSSTGASFGDAQERQRSPLLTSSAVNVRPQVPHISPTPHSASLPGPKAPNSADSMTSSKMSASTASRMPSLDAGGSLSEENSQFHSPATSPITPSFHASVQGDLKDVRRAGGSKSLSLTVDASGMNSSEVRADGEAEVDSDFAIPDSVRIRATEIEKQIKDLSQELNELRLRHVGSLSKLEWAHAATAANDPTSVQECPCCGCGCAEQRRMQSLNEAAVLKGVSVLERGRALKPSPNLGNTGKFGGYTNR